MQGPNREDNGVMAYYINKSKYIYKMKKQRQLGKDMEEEAMKAF